MFSCKKTFIWENIEGVVPAIYLGDEGIIIDLCIKIPVQKVKKFLIIWNQERRLSELSTEEYEQMEQEPPFNLNFSMDVVADEEKLAFNQSGGTGWHPLELEKENIEEKTEELMDEYQCDRNSGWYFSRMEYYFDTKTIKNPNTVQLNFKSKKAIFR